ncbi:MAG TPA: hypothetical protein VGH44_03110 [Candidatus Saccharimonadia bacterium]|jgi:predicted phosphoribosyltransferase
MASWIAYTLTLCDNKSILFTMRFMNYTSRVSLGNTLAQRLKEFRGKGAIVVCLEESSLLTCLTIASQIHAYVYPLLFEPIYSQDSMHQPLGAYDQDGELCPIPGTHVSESDLTPEMRSMLKHLHGPAVETVMNEKQKFGMELDKSTLNGRDVILAVDILTSVIPVIVARKLLSEIAPKSVTAVAGNATLETAQLLRLTAARTEILDVISGITFDPNHYFEDRDGYSTDQQHTLTRNIASYWQ